MFPIRSLSVSDLISIFIKFKWRERGSNKSSPQKMLFPLICSHLGEGHNDQQWNTNSENETSDSSNSVDSEVNPQDDDSMSC